MLIRLEALELAANAASADASDRYKLHNIQVRSDGSVIVTDGHQILRMQAAVMEPSLLDALLPAVERGFEGDVLVDAGDARDFKAACNKALKKAGRKNAADGGEPFHVVIAKQGDELTLATQDGTVERRFVIKQHEVEDRYPDIDRILPKEEQRHITVSVDLMLKLLRTLKRLKVMGVTLGLTNDPLAPISLKATSIAGEIDGALMPMRSGDEKPANSEDEDVDTETGEIRPRSSGEARACK